jgi:4-amino-4-deoxy-L-arabinose transferase-like glycosyltransferase
VRRSAESEAATAITLRGLVGSRLVVWAGGLAALALFGRSLGALNMFDPAHVTEPFRSGTVNALFAPAARWDSAWYLEIARLGYFTRISSAFFPLYPLLIHLVTAVFGSSDATTLVVALLISLAAMVAALYLLYLLTRLDFDDSVARTTVLLLAFFPTAFFLSAVYTESLFIALSLGAVYAARSERWLWAGVLGGLAAGTRSNGALILVPLVLLYLYGPRPLPPDRVRASWWRPRYRLASSASWLGLVPLGLAAYMVYLWISHGAPLAPFQTEVVWARSFAGPFGGVVPLLVGLPHDISALVTGTARPVGVGDPLSWHAYNLIDVGFLAFAGGGLALAWRRVPFAYFAYAVLFLAQVLSEPQAGEPLSSFGRYLLPLFPLFMAYGAVLARRPVLRRGVLTGSAVGLAVLTGMFTAWAWVA